MSRKSVVIKGVTIQKGDIVNIKFRKLEDILQDKRLSVRAAQVIDHYDMDEHMSIFLTGGHIKVDNVFPKEEGRLSLYNKRDRRSNSHNHTDDPDFLSEIEIDDHICGYGWVINEVLIESISVENDVAESYFSEKHQLSLVLIDNILYVNGHAITKKDSKILEMFESVMTEAAINNALATQKDFDIEDNLLKR